MNLEIEIKQYRHARKKITRKQRLMVELAEDENRSLTAAEEKKYQELNREFVNYTNAIEKAEATIRQRKGSNPAFRASIGGEIGPQMDGFEYYLRTADPSKIERRAMSVGTGSSGGYIVPDELSKELNEYLHDANAMRQIAAQKSVRTANYVRVFNLGGLSAGFVSETAARPDTDTPSLVEVTVPTGEMYCNAPVSQWMIDDAEFDLQGFIMGEVRNKFISLEGDAFINGTGTNAPKGILAYTTATTDDGTRAFGVLKHQEAGSAAAVSMDELIDLTLDLRGVYRQGAVWLMNSATAGYIRKLKDSTSNYLWQNSIQAGSPSQLNGYAVFIDESMPDLGASATPIAFGNFKFGYEIVDRTDFSVLVDPYSNKPYVNFYCTKRVSGMLVDSCAIRLLKMAAS